MPALGHHRHRTSAEVGQIQGWLYHVRIPLSISPRGRLCPYRVNDTKSLSVVMLYCIIMTTMCRLYDKNRKQIKIELKRGSLEPKWHWSVRYCCNFLCAKHGYRQITRHPISILLLSSVTAQVNLSHFTSLTLVAERTRNECLEAKAPPSNYQDLISYN